MSIMSWLNPVTAIGNVANGIIKTVAGDQSARDQQEHTENTTTLGQFAAEFAGRGKATWFDSLIDGINRLPRPFLALGVLGLMVWCPLDPIGFAEAMTAYALVPEWLAALFAVIVGFYFAARHLEQRLKFNGPSAEQVKAVVEAKKALATLRTGSNEPVISDERFKAELADTSKPLSNAAILEWNRRRQAGAK